MAERERDGMLCSSGVRSVPKEGLWGADWPLCPWISLPLPVSEPSPLRMWSRWQMAWSLVAPEGSLTLPCSGLTVSETGKAPLQRALQVTVPHFLDWSGEVLQPSR